MFRTGEEEIRIIRTRNYNVLDRQETRKFRTRGQKSSCLEQEDRSSRCLGQEDRKTGY